MGSVPIEEDVSHRYALRRRLLQSSCFDVAPKAHWKQAFVPLLVGGVAVSVFMVVSSNAPTQTEPLVINPIQMVEDATQPTALTSTPELTAGQKIAKDVVATYLDSRPIVSFAPQPNIVPINTFATYTK